MERMTGMNRPKRVGIYAGIYVRISDDREGAGLGVKRQEADCRAVAERLGWDVLDVYVDNDLSAYSGKPRPSYNRLLDDVRSGRVDSILVWHNDRLHRHPVELEDFIKILEEQNVPVQTVKAGQLDLSTPTGRMAARIVGAVARGESEHKADRIKRKHLELAEAGKPSGGGFRPYGYRPIYDREERPHKLIREDVVPEEAKIIQEAKTRVLAGEALIAVARDLNRRGIPTSGGGVWTQRRVREALAADPSGPLAKDVQPRLDAGETLSDVAKDLNRQGVPCPATGTWSTGTLSRLLTSARIAGQREHRPRSRHETRRVKIGEITAEKADWPAIITVDESRRLRSMLTDDKRRTSPGPVGRHLLTGVLACSRCEQTLVGRSRGRQQRHMYMCDAQPGRPGCGRMYIDGPGCDVVVARLVAEALSSPSFLAALDRRDDRPDDAVLLEEIAACEHDLKTLAADRGRQRFSHEEWLAAREPVEQRRQELRRALSRTDSQRVLAGLPGDEESLAAYLLDREVEVSRRRAVIFSAVERVMVCAAVRGRHRFDPDRLDPQWRV